ncbi:MAG: DUF2927 domain-containing protein [Amaricoccus sp.]|uniref:DUF2927 domain-containing protein n=1 Tax=Amaricoccus sp. TaxID=1872485 RepID=UPI0039E5460E
MAAAPRRGPIRAGRMQLGAGALALVVAGCAGTPEVAPPAPAAASLLEDAPPEPRAPASGTPPSDVEALRTFYAGVEQQLFAAGRLRQDPAPPDAPFSNDDLIRDFVHIALYDEYTDVNGRFMHEERPAPIRRWETPVRVSVMTGASESPEDAARDRGNVAAFTQRLAHLTGRDIALSDGTSPNFLVLFMTSAERQAFADQVHSTYPDFAPAVVTALRNASVDDFCITYTFWDKTNSSVYSAVFVLIRAEHPAFTKMSCVQEEMSQAMGLPNDSPEARPSLYNDDLEFAVLTEHDAILLRMLYDPRLKPGMTAAEVLPLLPAIAADARAAEERDSGVTVATN